MGLWPALKLRLRFNARLGCYARARKMGLSEEDARAAVNREYLPTPQDLAFEDQLKTKDAARRGR